MAILTLNYYKFILFATWGFGVLGAITHQTTDDIKEKLRGKLARLVNPQPEVEDATVIEAQLLDTDEEFGFDDDD